MSTATMGSTMTWDQVRETADAFGDGITSLKGVAFTLTLYHEEHGGDADADTLATLTGVKKSSAYRVLELVRFQRDARKKRISEVPNRYSPHISEVPNRHFGTSALQHSPSPDVSPPTPPSSYPPSPALSLAPPPACEEPPAVEAPDPEPEAAPVPAIAPGGPDVEEVVRLIEDWSAGTLAYWARSACKSYPSAWVREVCERKLMGQRRQPPINVLNAVLRDWRAKGMSDDEAKRLDEPNPPPALKATGTSGPAPRSNTPQTAEERERFVRELNEL